MKNTFLTLIILLFVAQTCKTQDRPNKLQQDIEGMQPLPEAYHSFYFKNESDYAIEIYKYSYSDSAIYSLDGEYETDNRNCVYTPSRRSRPFRLSPGEETCESSYLTDRISMSYEVVVPYCTFIHYGQNDSLRIYFNRGQSDERYVTYRYDGFKPRDIRDIKVYEIERIERPYPDLPNYPEGTYDVFDYYYTFTNEDYENAEQHQNTVSTPIPECQDGDKRCWFEGGVICY